MLGLKRFAEVFEWVVGQIARIFGCLAAVALGLVVVVLVFSSVQRYLLTRPIPVTEELAAYLFICIAFFSIAEGFISDRQIKITFLWAKLPPKARRALSVVGYLAAFAILTVVIRQLAAFAWSSFQFQSRSYVADFLEWPWMMVPVASLVAAAAGTLVRLSMTVRAKPGDGDDKSETDFV